MFDFLVLAFLIILNGIFAMSEIALVSSRKIRLEKLAKGGSKRAATALKLVEDPNKFLPTVQIGMTAVSILAGVFSAATIGGDLAEWFRHFSFMKDYANFLGYFLVVTATTFFTLVVGELVPKTIGLNKPEQIAVLTAPFMQFVSWIASPLILILNFWTSLILKGLSITRKKSEPPVTEEELTHLIEQSGEHGVLEKEETQIIKSVLRIGDRRVDSFMTHRSDLIWIDKQDSDAEILRKLSETTHSNFPLCRESLDEVLGIVSIKDIFMQVVQTGKINLDLITKDPMYVPETLDAIELLEIFRKSRVHCGLILNEYGSLEGMVTLHDLMEAMMGELPNAEEAHVEDMIVTRDDGSLLIDGRAQTDVWMDALGLSDPGEADPEIYKTLGGFVMHQLGKVPQEADSFVFAGYIFEVVDMDALRVDKVLVRRTEHKEN